MAKGSECIVDLSSADPDPSFSSCSDQDKPTSFPLPPTMTSHCLYPQDVAKAIRRMTPETGTHLVLAPDPLFGRVAAGAVMHLREEGCRFVLFDGYKVLKSRWSNYYDNLEKHWLKMFFRSKSGG